MNAKCVHSEKCAKNAVYHLRSALKTDHKWSVERRTLHTLDKRHIGDVLNEV